MPYTFPGYFPIYITAPLSRCALKCTSASRNMVYVRQSLSGQCVMGIARWPMVVRCCFILLLLLSFPSSEMRVLCPRAIAVWRAARCRYLADAIPASPWLRPYVLRDLLVSVAVFSRCLFDSLARNMGRHRCGSPAAPVYSPPLIPSSRAQSIIYSRIRLYTRYLLFIYNGLAGFGWLICYAMCT